MGEKDLTCLQRAKRILAFDHWWAHIVHYTNAFVNLRSVLFYLLLEIVAAALLIVFYLRFKQVAELGFLMQDWHSYIIVASFRALTTLGGMFVLWRRDLNQSRVFYFFLLFNFVMGLVCIRPAFLLDCECTSWYQCHGLGAFAGKANDIMNPWSFPVESRFDKERRIPVEEPPPSQDALSLLSEYQQEAKAPHGRALSVDAAERARVDMQQAGQQLQQDKHKQAAHSSILMEQGKQEVKAPRPAAASLAEVAITTDGVARLRPRSSSVVRERDGPAETTQLRLVDGDTDSKSEAWDYFSVTGASLGWTSTQSEVGCKENAVNETHYKTLMTFMHQMRSGEVVDQKDQQLPWLTTQLWLCMKDPLCALVHLTLMGEEGARSAKACRVERQAVPQLQLSPATDDTVKQTWFQKDYQAVHEYELSAKESHKVVSGVFKTASVSDAMNTMSELHSEECACNDDTSCRIHTDAQGQDKFWCWVSAEKKDACAAMNVALSWDANKKAYWGEGLCHQADCKCSGYGMHPTAQDLANQKFSPDVHLYDNKMNYGSSCKKWHVDDEWPWCFVGFDSICPDRYPDDRKSRFSAEIPQNIVGMTWQWRSQLPCNPDAQMENVELAADFCENIAVAAQVVLIALLVLSLPMYVVVFQFISNRCCDFTETEEQFEVEFSDEESDEEGQVAGQDAGAHVEAASGS